VARSRPKRRQCFVEPTLDGWACCLAAGHEGPHGRYAEAFVEARGVEQEYAEDWPVIGPASGAKNDAAPRQKEGSTDAA
jgi:hypothetical protein